MSYVLPDESESPRITPVVQWLIAINVAIYFLQLTVVGADNMQQALGFHIADLSKSWWTIATYMFVHGGFWHLAFNMYTLFLFGPRVEQAWSAGEFSRYYILCGIGGWFTHLLFARNAPMVGASAAIFGVMVAYAMRWPDEEIYLFGVVPLKVKWLVAILAITNIVSGMTSGQSTGVAYLAHVGGMATGWLYLRTSSATSIERLRQRVSQVPDVSDESPRAIPRSSSRSRERVQDSDDIVAQSKATADTNHAHRIANQQKGGRAERRARQNLSARVGEPDARRATAPRRVLEEPAEQPRRREEVATR
jgi:membrane associated rhomboid family serine protease